MCPINVSLFSHVGKHCCRNKICFLPLFLSRNTQDFLRLKVIKVHNSVYYFMYIFLCYVWTKHLQKNETKVKCISTSIHSQKTPQTCCKLSILLVCLNLSINCNKLVNFIKLQQVCYNQTCRILSFADLLQLVETTCSKPVDKKFWPSSCDKTCRQQAVASHANAS